MTRRLATLILLASTTPLAAQWLTLPTPGIPRTADGTPDLSGPAPRAADGHPDLTGLWGPARLSGELLDPAEIPEQVRMQMAERERSFFDDAPYYRCLPSGPGYITAGPIVSGSRRIVQNPIVIAILHSDLVYRQIFMDGRELEPDPFPTWMGYSIGRWEGDTLVVESNGYNDKTWLHSQGLSHTENLRITERYRRPDFGRLQIEITYEDPGLFDSPVHALAELKFAADDELLENVCNEASEGRSHWGGEITEAEQKAVEIAEEILAKYVGTYDGTWLGRLITLEFTLEDGALFLERTPPYEETGFTAAAKSRLVAQSGTAFECSCGLGFVFTAKGEEMATEVAEVHVSGAWTFKRVP